MGNPTVLYLSNVAAHLKNNSKKSVPTLKSGKVRISTLFPKEHLAKLAPFDSLDIAYVFGNPDFTGRVKTLSGILFQALPDAQFSKSEGLDGAAAAIIGALTISGVIVSGSESKEEEGFSLKEGFSKMVSLMTPKYNWKTDHTYDEYLGMVLNFDPKKAKKSGYNKSKLIDSIEEYPELPKNSGGQVLVVVDESGKFFEEENTSFWGDNEGYYEGDMYGDFSVEPLRDVAMTKSGYEYMYAVTIGNNGRTKAGNDFSPYSKGPHKLVKKVLRAIQDNEKGLFDEYQDIARRIMSKTAGNREKFLITLIRTWETAMDGELFNAVKRYKAKKAQLSVKLGTPDSAAATSSRAKNGNTGRGFGSSKKNY